MAASRESASAARLRAWTGLASAAWVLGLARVYSASCSPVSGRRASGAAAAAAARMAAPRASPSSWLFSAAWASRAARQGGGRVCRWTRAAPWAAILIGFCGGSLSAVGFRLIGPALSARINLQDTCGVHSLHGMPGVLGAIVSGIAAAGRPSGSDVD
jgi:hypothetical protein